MTTKIAKAAKSPAPPDYDCDRLEKFPDFPPRDDMNNPRYLYDPGHPPALRRHLGSPDTTIVLGEIPISWRPGQVRDALKPDLLVAFDVDCARIFAQEGYAISDVGKPPDFVLEVASKSTGRRDETVKRLGYARYGVLEYWRYDPSGGAYHRGPLAGDRLVDGVYQPVRIHRIDANRYWGYSAALHLVLCWEYGQLRWYDPVAGRYLDTFDEEAEARIAERNARIAERNARIAERGARIAAEARVHELEDEIRRLRNPRP